MMNTPTLETERLISRKFTEDDLEALFLILKDKDVNTFLPWYPIKNIDETAGSSAQDMALPAYAYPRSTEWKRHSSAKAAGRHPVIFPPLPAELPPYIYVNHFITIIKLTI